MAACSVDEFLNRLSTEAAGLEAADGLEVVHASSLRLLTRTSLPNHPAFYPFCSGFQNRFLGSTRDGDLTIANRPFTAPPFSKET